MSQAGKLVEGSSSPDVETLTGNSGGAVGPDGAFNINVVGTGSVTVVGDAGTNTLTIANSDAAWTSVSVSTLMSANVGYFCVSPGGALVMTLPVLAAANTVIKLCLDGATSFQVAQNAGQTIRVGNSTTTTGVGGSLTTIAQGDSLEIVCRTANTDFDVVNMVGNFLIV